LSAAESFAAENPRNYCRKSDAMDPRIRPCEHPRAGPDRPGRRLAGRRMCQGIFRKGKRCARRPGRTRPADQATPTRGRGGGDPACSAGSLHRDLLNVCDTEGRERAKRTRRAVRRPLKLSAHQRREVIERLDAVDAVVDVARTFGVDRATRSSASRGDRAAGRWGCCCPCCTHVWGGPGDPLSDASGGGPVRLSRLRLFKHFVTPGSPAAPAIPKAVPVWSKIFRSMTVTSSPGLSGGGVITTASQDRQHQGWRPLAGSNALAGPRRMGLGHCRRGSWERSL
jgi:hypothetical protein